MSLAAAVALPPLVVDGAVGGEVDGNLVDQCGKLGAEIKSRKARQRGGFAVLLA